MEAHVPKAERAYIVGAGASGVVLAGAAIVFISVVGLVSSTEWPDSDHRIEPVNSSLDPALSQRPLGVPAASPVAAPARAPAVAAPASPVGEASADRREEKRRNGSKGEGNRGSNVATVPPAAASPVGAGTSNPGRSRDQGGTNATARSGDESPGSSGGSSATRRRSDTGSSSTRGSGSRRNGRGKGGGRGKGNGRANELGGDKGLANGLGLGRR
ncbi:MAG TPA: hypothetical protein VFL56_04275 [Solirubrobacterales bacterium]|nr:hypothetical protein [Solirubrobacterales bacterium]